MNGMLRGPLLALLSASTVSQAGNAMTLLAVPWYTLQTTGSASRTGLVAGSTVGAYVIGGFFGGTVADRFDRKRVAITADLFSGAMIAAIPALAGLDRLSFPLLLLLVFTSALLDAPGAAARFAMIPDLARLAGVRLERANGLIHGASSSAEILGPMLVAGLLTVTTPTTVLYLDAATFLVSLLVTLLFIPRGLGRDGALGAEDLTKIHFLAGLRYLRRHRLLRTLTMADLATNFIGAPLFVVIMVVYVSRTYGEAFSLGPIVAVGGVGLVLGALAYSRWGDRIPRRRWFLIGFASFGAQYWLLALQPPILLILVVFGVRGLLTGMYNPITDTVLQERVPSQLRGSVYGTAMAVAIMGEPVGLVAAGLLVEHTSLLATILLSATAYAVVTGLLVMSPSLHQMAPGTQPGAPDR